MQLIDSILIVGAKQKLQSLNPAVLPAFPTMIKNFPNSLFLDIFGAKTCATIIFAHLYSKL